MMIRHKLILSSFIFALFSAAPVAMAQDVCGDVDANGADADFFVCDDTPYADGIVHDTNGNLSLIFSGNTALGTGGLNVTGNGGDTFSLSAIGELTSSNGVQEVVDVGTDSGDITLGTSGRGITANSSSGTHAIRALSNTGNIAISTTGHVRAESQANGVAAIEARIDNAGGPARDIDISAGLFTIPGASAGSGSIRGGGGHGILAAIEGAGDVTINTEEDVFVAVSGGSTDPALVATAAIEASAAEGDVRLNLRGRVGWSGDNTLASEPYGVGAGISVHAGGTAIINMTGNLVSRVNLYAPNASGGLGLSVGTDGLALLGSGNRVELNMMSTSQNSPLQDNSGQLDGAVDLSAVTGSSELIFNRGTRWRLYNDDNILSPAEDVVEIRDGAIMSTYEYFNGGVFLGGRRGPNASLEGPSILDFNDGTDRLRMDGEIWLGVLIFGANSGSDESAQSGSDRTDAEGQMTFRNLTDFDMAGHVYLGRIAENDLGVFKDTAGFLSPRTGAIVGPTDRWQDDMLALPGATWNALAGSRVFMDVKFGNARQSGCDAGLYNAVGDLPAADCVDLRDGTAVRGPDAEGSAGETIRGGTGLVIYDVVPGDQGAYHPDGIVLVDASTGDDSVPDSDADAFFIDPLSEGYVESYGGAIGKGIFLYPLVYDEANRQFKLQAVPNAAGQQQPLMANAAQMLWRDTAGSWFERQVDIRDLHRDGQGGGGVWLRVNRQTAERNVITSSRAAGQTFRSVNDHDVSTWSLMAGVDMLSGDNLLAFADGNWVVGGMIGYANGDVDFKNWTSDTRLDGMNLGAYASYVGESLFVDALVNAQWLKLRQDIPSLELSDSAILHNDGDSVGARVEAGWRFKFGALGVEPLLSWSHSTVSFDDAILPAANPARVGSIIDWDDATSQRTGAGLRLTADLPLDWVNVGLSLTGRVVDESDGESRAIIVSSNGLGPEVEDTFDGSFTDIVTGVTVANNPGTSAGFFNLETQSGDGYDSLGVSLGYRYQW